MTFALDKHIHITFAWKLGVGMVLSDQNNLERMKHFLSKSSVTQKRKIKLEQKNFKK